MAESMPLTAAGVFKIVLPEMIRTRKISGESNMTPRNDKLPRTLGPGNTSRLARQVAVHIQVFDRSTVVAVHIREYDPEPSNLAD